MFDNFPLQAARNYLFLGNKRSNCDYEISSQRKLIYVGVEAEELQNSAF